MAVPFDEMAKALAGDVSRREALGRVSSLFVAALMASLGLGSKAWAYHCPKGTIDCGNGVCCGKGRKSLAGSCCVRVGICGTPCGSLCCLPTDICSVNPITGGPYCQPIG